MKRSVLLAAAVAASAISQFSFASPPTRPELDRFKKGKKQAQWKREQYGRKGKK